MPRQRPARATNTSATSGAGQGTASMTDKDWAQWVNAAIGAYGAYQGAQQANRPRDSRTDQTTTQRPYAEPLIAPRVESGLSYLDQLMAAGPRYIGPGSTPGARAARQARGGGAGAGRPGGSATWTNARGQAMTLDSRGRAVPASQGGAPAPGGGATPGAPRGIEGIANEVARRGFEAGTDSTTMAARQGVENILSGQGGASGGGSGFQGYNPISDWLAGQLRGDVSQREAADLLRQFLGDDFGDNAGGGFRGGSGRVSYGPPAYVQQMHGSSSTTPGSGGVPDTVGNSSAYFAQQVRQLMDQGASDADVQAVIDAANADARRAMQDDLWALDAQAQGAGRFGGDMWAGLSSQARADAQREMLTNASRTRLGEMEQRRAMQQALLGQVNARDIAAMNDATQRYGIDASARASGAGAADAAAATRRAQNLQALGMLLNNDQFNIGAMGDLGAQLSDDRRAAIGYASPLAGIGLSGLGLAGDAANTLVGHEGNQVALRNAQIAAGTARAGMNQQAQMFNSQMPWNMANDYMRNLGLVAGLGGTSTTQGTNVVPGMNVNPWGAAALGGAAGYYGSGR